LARDSRNARPTFDPRSVEGWCAILLLVPSFGDRGENTDPIRISDAERNAAVERLNAFFAEGRLDLEECSSRLDEVNAARTDVELDNAFRGLPKPAPSSQNKVVQRDFRARAERVVAIATPGAACTLIWAFTGHSNYWPEWVWLATGIVELRRFRPSRRRQTLERLGRPAYGDPPPIATDGHDRRMVLTAVFVDIVGSTEKAAALGDSRWREILRSFEHLVERELAAHHGRKLFTKGDEIVATFRSPAGAIEYARGVRDAVRPLQLEVRVGIHTGEVEGHSGDLSGITLHIGQRVSATALTGEILVSSTVRDLALGSGLEFVDRGEHDLRGLPGSWHLYAVGDGNERP